MENSLKQRVVGAVVLIALAVIFLPAILKEKAEREPFESQIPAKPISLVEHQVAEETAAKNEQISEQLDKLEEQEQKLPPKKSQEKISNTNSQESTDSLQDSAASAAESKSKAVAKKQADDKRAIKKQLGAAYKDAAWVIKVASFSNLDNAKKMVEQLKKKGHKAYRRSGKNQQGKTVYRIYVGPYIEKSRASAKLSSISKLSQSQAILLVFDPTKH